LESALVIGAGLFGLTGARELARRGATVTVLEAGQAPHPDGASNDVSKVVRPDYGDDDLYTALAEESLAAWPDWSDRLGGGLFHRTGLLVATRAPFDERPFEQATFARLAASHGLERLEGAAVRQRFPAFGTEDWVDGYFNPAAGWVDSGAATAGLAALARQEGVDLREHTPVASLVEANGRVRGVRLASGAVLEADLVLVAAGSWTPTLVPWLGDRLRAIGQPVFHLRPEDPTPFTAPALPVWAADITTTGWYGFPALEDGHVKVGHHGPGRPVTDPRPAGPPHDLEPDLRAFLRGALPTLADAPLVGGRWCPYCDSFDGDFWIGRDPERDGLVVAAGGSGHAFKFLPVIGPVVADACEGRQSPRFARFGWREAGSERRDAMRLGGA
jgi:sarcosine oxidase/L-pipecolate oxidase